MVNGIIRLNRKTLNHKKPKLFCDSHLGEDISVATLFTSNTVALLHQQLTIGATKNSLLKPLSRQDKAFDSLFMIHPGNAGCEVYVEMTNLLARQFSCIGVDNYNLLDFGLIFRRSCIFLS